MARKLPWMAQESKTKPVQSAKPSTGKRQSPDDHTASDSSDGFEGQVPTFKPKQHVRKSHQRNPSSSPPPAPPQEEYMISGLEHDDGWVMVEDEFLTTAKLFTAHLHNADYQRLK